MQVQSATKTDTLINDGIEKGRTIAHMPTPAPINVSLPLPSRVSYPFYIVTPSRVRENSMDDSEFMLAQRQYQTIMLPMSNPLPSD